MKPSPTGVRLLIVDDEHDNRELLRIILEREGFLVITASSGCEALAAVAQQPPDLILLDVMMPEMNGYEVAAKLSGDVVTKDIPVIMVTALHDHRAKTLSRVAGASEFLSKPVDLVELLVRVRNLLRLDTGG